MHVQNIFTLHLIRSKVFTLLFIKTVLCVLRSPILSDAWMHRNAPAQIHSRCNPPQILQFTYVVIPQAVPNVDSPRHVSDALHPVQDNERLPRTHLLHCNTIQAQLKATLCPPLGQLLQTNKISRILQMLLSLQDQVPNQRSPRNSCSWRNSEPRIEGVRHDIEKSARWGTLPSQTYCCHTSMHPVLCTTLLSSSHYSVLAIVTWCRIG